MVARQKYIDSGIVVCVFLDIVVTACQNYEFLGPGPSIEKRFGMNGGHDVVLFCGNH